MFLSFMCCSWLETEDRPQTTRRQLSNTFMLLSDIPVFNCRRSSTSLENLGADCFLPAVPRVAERRVPPVVRVTVPPLVEVPCCSATSRNPEETTRSLVRLLLCLTNFSKFSLRVERKHWWGFPGAQGLSQILHLVNGSGSGGGGWIRGRPTGSETDSLY